MGNRLSQSKEIEKTVYETLEVDPTATEAEIKAQYYKLLLKYHPNTSGEKNLEKTRNIIAAYQKLRDQDFKPILIDMFQVPNFNKYSREYFQRLDEDKFYYEVTSIYDIILKNEKRYNDKIKLPTFGNKLTKMTHNSLFYIFYKSFKTSVRFEVTRNNKNVYDKDFDKEKGRMYNESIRNLTKIVLSVDPRLKRNIHESVVKSAIEIKVVKKKIKVRKEVEEYAFYCDACRKGFMSENTMVNHVKGSKHKQKIEELGVCDKSVEEIRNEMKIINNKEEDINEKEYEIKEENNEVKNDEIYAKKIEEEANKKDNKNVDEGIEIDLDAKIKILENKISKIHVSKKKHKIPKKNKATPGKESFQLLVCAKCKVSFESRNKLFEHLRNDHT